MSQAHTFEDFAVMAEPRLRRALLGAVGADRVSDAVAEALAYGYEHWEAVAAMDNPVGYLYRVGRSRVRSPRRPRVFRRIPDQLPEVEPGLIDALQALPESQRTAVWLAHGCGWTHGEIAEAVGVAPSTIATHVSRALSRLRAELGASSDAEY